MKSNVDLSTFFKPIGKLIGRFHLTIFIIFVIGCLVAAVLLLTNILNEASMGNYESPITAGSIDQATLNRVNALHTSADPATYPAPPVSGGRTSPFSE